MMMHKVLYECVTGSHMHGTNTETSDIDSRVIYRDSLRERLSPFAGTTVRTDEETDRSYYELSHFAKMLAKCSPTSIELCYGIKRTGDVPLIVLMGDAAMDTEKYAAQCNGMILGMVKKATPKSLHHAARIHTHLTKYLGSGIMRFDAKGYENFDYLMALKRGEAELDEKYTKKVEVTHIFHKQRLDRVEELVTHEYMEDIYELR